MPQQQHGGAREGAGAQKPEMKSVKLSREHWEKARRIGNGNMAKGIRRALDSFRT
jgi:hypothetical protein